MFKIGDRVILDKTYLYRIYDELFAKSNYIGIIEEVDEFDTTYPYKIYPLKDKKCSMWIHTRVNLTLINYNINEIQLELNKLEQELLKCQI